jgi:hypothetical protein
MGGHVERMGQKRDVHRVLLGEPEGKKHLGDPEVGVDWGRGHGATTPSHLGL